jgi:hypothetical protein
MMARAVALPSWLRIASMISSPLPSRLQRLMVWFPELIQYSLLSGKSIARPGKWGQGIAVREPGTRAGSRVGTEYT